MTPDEREQHLADALADLVDAGAAAAPRRQSVPEISAELETLAEIDRVIEPATALPSHLSGHKVVAEIGSGGMGRVLLAVDEALGRQVAIKTLAPRYAEDSVLRARFMHEARAMARLNHPNIVRIYNLGQAGEPPHFVMEYLEGAPLTRAALKLTWQQKAELMRKVVLAVQFLHEHGIVHRDLKPANILVAPDLEPKLLDFGLALDLGPRQRFSKPGDIVGTPEYLSPEQAEGAETLDARSDIFSLGSVFYELLAGVTPFEAETAADLLRLIREEDPALPRRRNPSIPQGLQNVCLKAMEKDPAQRYASAREMADDLQRFLAGEPVLAAPGAYTRLITGKVAEHLQDLETWRREEIVSEGEYDGIRKRYSHLIERDDAWIMEARRLTLAQVTLYFGGWVLAVGATLLTFFRYPAVSGWPAILIAWSAALPVAWIGRREWNRQYYRVAIAFMLALCLLAPITALVTLEEGRWLTGLTQGKRDLELFIRLEAAKPATNAQLWWSLLAGLPVCWYLRRFTRTPVFSLMFSTTAAMLAIATLLRMGMLDWLDQDPGRFYFHLIPCAALFMAAGFLLEYRRLSDDSRYFYVFAAVFTWVALSGVAGAHEPYSRWLNSFAPWTRGQKEYLFLINAGIYFLLDVACDLVHWEQVRNVGKAFRFVIPGHVMTSLLMLGLSAKSQFETRVFEWLLPAVACIFVFASIQRQMKNFFAAGLLFFAIGTFRLQQEIFENRSALPVVLLCAGLALMLAAANYAPLKVALGRFFSPRPVPKE